MKRWITNEPPGVPSRGAVYFQAAFMVFPALFVWRFSYVFLIPKLNQIWEETGLTNSSAQWLIAHSQFWINIAPSVLALIAIISVLAEKWNAKWNRCWRGFVLGSAVAFQTAVLLGVTAIACASLIAAPLMGRKARNSKLDSDTSFPEKELREQTP